MKYDLVVAGAGPAGSAMARAAARAGARVLVIEEHRNVGSPVQCSGFVTPRTLELAKVPTDGLVQNHVSGAVIYGPEGHTLRLGGDRVRALALDRRLLDRRLAQAAIQAGAILSTETRLVDIQRNNSHLELGLWRGPRRERLRVETPLLIGADGWNSTVARWMGIPPGPVIRCISIDAYLAGQPQDMAQVLVGSDIAPGWFAWVIPLGHDLVRIGIGCDPERSPLPVGELLRRLLNTLGLREREFEPIARVGGFIPLYHANGGPPTPLSTSNVMLVGDAARQVKPTSGGGIYASLVAAQWASQVALQALKLGDFSADRLAIYDAGWRTGLGAELHRELDLRRLFLELDDHKLSRLIKVLRFPGAQYLIRRYGDIDYQTPLFSRLLRLVPALCDLLPIASRLPSLWERITLRV